MVSYLACVKTNMETHEMIQNCGLIYSIDREKIHLPVTSNFCSENLFRIQWAKLMFISSEMVLQVTLAILQWKDSILSMKFLKLIAR